MNLIELIPDSDESMLKIFLIFSINYHIEQVTTLTKKEKIELLILKKFFIVSPIKKIFENINLKFIDKKSKFNNLELIFTEEFKQYINIEYNKYLENNIEKIC